MEVQVVDGSPDEIYGNLFLSHFFSVLGNGRHFTRLQYLGMQATYPGANDLWDEHDCWCMAKEVECGLDAGLETL